MFKNQELFGTNLIEDGEYTHLWDAGARPPMVVPTSVKHFNKLLENRKKEMGPDWYYYNKDISYVYNKNGFRTTEFKNIDWKNSIVVLGCSIVTGIGNSIDDTISSNLENILGASVINLGVSGSSIDHACWNSLILHENYPTPKAIVQLWTSTNRYTDLSYNIKSNPYTVLGNSIHVDNQVPHHKEYCLHHSWNERSKFYVWSDRTLWKNKIPYYEASFFQHSAEELKIDFLETIDTARDEYHPGHKSNKKAAEIISSNLVNLGLSL